MVCSALSSKKRQGHSDPLNVGLAGQRYTKVTEQRTQEDWAHFIKELIDQHYPHVEKIRLVMDNLNIHTKAALYAAFDPPEAKRIADKLEVH